MPPDKKAFYSESGFSELEVCRILQTKCPGFQGAIDPERKE
jgi:hypothetical protein